MDYMDQSVTCRQCGGETSQIITGICPSCEFSASAAARKAAWDAKSDTDKALDILESFANPQHMTFSKEKAAFVLDVFRSLAAPVAEQSNSAGQVDKIDSSMAAHQADRRKAASWSARAVQDAEMALNADRARRVQERGPDRRGEQAVVPEDRRAGNDRRVQHDRYPVLS
jgi:ribosomal protein L37E